MPKDTSSGSITSNDSGGNIRRQSLQKVSKHINSQKSIQDTAEVLYEIRESHQSSSGFEKGSEKTLSQESRPSDTKDLEASVKAIRGDSKVTIQKATKMESEAIINKTSKINAEAAISKTNCGHFETATNKANKRDSVSAIIRANRKDSVATVNKANIRDSEAAISEANKRNSKAVSSKTCKIDSESAIDKTIKRDSESAIDKTIKRDSKANIDKDALVQKYSSKIKQTESLHKSQLQQYSMKYPLRQMDTLKVPKRVKRKPRRKTKEPKKRINNNDIFNSFSQSGTMSKPAVNTNMPLRDMFAVHEETGEKQHSQDIPPSQVPQPSTSKSTSQKKEKSLPDTLPPIPGTAKQNKQTGSTILQGQNTKVDKPTFFGSLPVLNLRSVSGKHVQNLFTPLSKKSALPLIEQSKKEQSSASPEKDTTSQPEPHTAMLNKDANTLPKQSKKESHRQEAGMIKSATKGDELPKMSESIPPLMNKEKHSSKSNTIEMQNETLTNQSNKKESQNVLPPINQTIEYNELYSSLSLDEECKPHSAIGNPISERDQSSLSLELDEEQHASQTGSKKSKRNDCKHGKEFKQPEMAMKNHMAQSFPQVKEEKCSSRQGSSNMNHNGCVDAKKVTQPDISYAILQEKEEICPSRMDCINIKHSASLTKGLSLSDSQKTQTNQKKTSKRETPAPQHAVLYNELFNSLSQVDNIKHGAIKPILLQYCKPQNPQSERKPVPAKSLVNNKVQNFVAPSQSANKKNGGSCTTGKFSVDADLDDHLTPTSHDETKDIQNDISREVMLIQRALQDNQIDRLMIVPRSSFPSTVGEEDDQISLISECVATSDTSSKEDKPTSLENVETEKSSEIVLEVAPDKGNNKMLKSSHAKQNPTIGETQQESGSLVYCSNTSKQDTQHNYSQSNRYRFLALSGQTQANRKCFSLTDQHNFSQSNCVLSTEIKGETGEQEKEEKWPEKTIKENGISGSRENWKASNSKVIYKAPEEEKKQETYQLILPVLSTVMSPSKQLVKAYLQRSISCEKSFKKLPQIMPEAETISGSGPQTNTSKKKIKTSKKGLQKMSIGKKKSVLENGVNKKKTMKQSKESKEEMSIKSKSKESSVIKPTWIRRLSADKCKRATGQTSRKKMKFKSSVRKQKSKAFEIEEDCQFKSGKELLRKPNKRKTSLPKLMSIQQSQAYQHKAEDISSIILERKVRAVAKQIHRKDEIEDGDRSELETSGDSIILEPSIIKHTWTLGEAEYVYKKSSKGRFMN